MGKIACLALLVLSTSVTFADAPETQPSPIDEAAISKLVRQLDHPNVKRREEAANTLEEMGEPVAPYLEAAAESASYETRTRIEAILRALREPLRAVIVYRVQPDSQAALLDLRTGTIITHIEDRPIRDCAEFREIARARKNITIRLTQPDHYRYVVLKGQLAAAMLRHEYAAAEQAMSRFAIPTHVPESVREANQFLKAHAADLIGDLASWRHTMLAHALKSGGWLLLTRDRRLGYASPDAKTIREIPPPTQRWHPLSASHALLNTRGQAGVLTTSTDMLYLLKPDRDGWEPLARLPEYYGAWDVAQLGPALDHLIPLLRGAGPEPVRIVEPQSLPSTLPRMFSIMLSNGVWLSCDTRTGTVWQPLPLSRAVLGETTEIYWIYNSRFNSLRAFVFTSRGLLEWHPDKGPMKLIPLPDVDGPMAVCPTTEGPALPAGQLRVALLPQNGGTTYVVDTATGRARREGCINEYVPPTFWRQKTAEWKRKMLAEAMGAADVKYPWAASAPTID